MQPQIKMLEVGRMSSQQQQVLGVNPGNLGRKYQPEVMPNTTTSAAWLGGKGGAARRGRLESCLENLISSEQSSTLR